MKRTTQSRNLGDHIGYVATILYAISFAAETVHEYLYLSSGIVNTSPSWPTHSLLQAVMNTLLIVWLATFPMGSILRANQNRLKTKRERLGCCGTCGFDLCASIEKCPECGEPITFKRRAVTAEELAAIKSRVA